MTIPKTMKGVQLIGHGGPEKNFWNDNINIPALRLGDVLVRVLAAGVNNTDINTRIGWYSKDISVSTQEVEPDTNVDAGGWSGALNFPRIQGSDLCGEVVAVGEGVTNFRIGTRVTCPTNQPYPTAGAPTRFRAIGSEFDGAFAQYCVVPGEQLYDVSSSPLTDIEIASIPCAHGTAFNLLRRANVVQGDRVLITGASGGVGLAAVELARYLGAKVTGIASSGKQAAVLAAGAHEVLDRDITPEAGSFTAAIDVVGGDRWSSVLEALAPGGRYAVSGAIAGPIVHADLRTIYLNDLTLYGCSFTPREVFSDLIKLVNTGQIAPVISGTYPLSEIKSAQEDFSAKKFPGKLILIPPEL